MGGAVQCGAYSETHNIAVSCVSCVSCVRLRECTVLHPNPLMQVLSTCGQLSAPCPVLLPRTTLGLVGLASISISQRLFPARALDTAALELDALKTLPVPKIFVLGVRQRSTP